MDELDQRCQACVDADRPGVVAMVLPRPVECGHAPSTIGYKFCGPCAKKKGVCAVCGEQLGAKKASRVVDIGKRLPRVGDKAGKKKDRGGNQRRRFPLRSSKKG